MTAVVAGISTATIKVCVPISKGAVDVELEFLYTARSSVLAGGANSEYCTLRKTPE
jgi:hypothetical protein